MHIKKLPLEQVISSYKTGHSAVWAASLLVVTRDCHCEIQSHVKSPQIITTSQPAKFLAA